MLDLMVAWKQHGGSRLDRDLDGKIDDPGAAIMDGSWNRRSPNAFMQPKLGPQLDELNRLFSRFDLPPSGQYDGWYQYFDRDIRSLLGMQVKSPFNNAYCGNGSLKRCQSAIWSAIATAGDGPDRRPGHQRPVAVALGRDRGADRVLARSASRRRCATPTGRAGSSR